MLDRAGLRGPNPVRNVPLSPLASGNLMRMSEQTSVYLLWHRGESDPYEGPLLLGVYSTRERAQARILEAKAQPGFRDHPEDFEIDECQVDETIGRRAS